MKTRMEKIAQNTMKINKLKKFKFENNTIGFKIYSNKGIYFIGGTSKNSPELSYEIMLAIKDFQNI